MQARFPVQPIEPAGSLFITLVLSLVIFFNDSFTSNAEILNSINNLDPLL
jgi:hypothetical protein